MNNTDEECECVPFVVQKKNMCSEASASMVLKHHGFDVSQDDIAKMDCTTFENMEPCVNKFLKCTTKADQNIDDIKKEVEECRPVMVRVLPKGQEELHTLVVTDCRDNKVIANDPAIGTVEIDVDEFLGTWEGSNKSAIYCRGGEKMDSEDLEQLEKHAKLGVVGINGIVVNRDVAENTPCKCYEYEPDKFLCWSSGVIGALTDHQEEMFCKPRVILEAPPGEGVGERIRKFKEASKVCKSLPIIERLKCMSREAKKRGIEI